MYLCFVLSFSEFPPCSLRACWRTICELWSSCPFHRGECRFLVSNHPNCSDESNQMLAPHRLPPNPLLCDSARSISQSLQPSYLCSPLKHPSALSWPPLPSSPSPLMPEPATTRPQGRLRPDSLWLLFADYLLVVFEPRCVGRLEECSNLLHFIQFEWIPVQQ